MPLNKGEWSELYIGLLCLEVGEIPLFNSKQNINVKKIGFEADHLITKNQIEDLKNSIQKIQKDITAGRGSFLLDSKLINDTRFKKSVSSKKADIVLHYELNNKNFTDNFSIKSRSGASPSIVNASQATNFVFTVHTSDLHIFTKFKKPKELVSQIKSEKIKMTFDKCLSQKFTSNLKTIDSNMDILLAEILLLYFAGDENCLAEIVTSNYTGPVKKKIEQRLKQFLYCALTGMSPTKVWDKKSEIAGCIVLEKTGLLTALHTSDLDNFKDYIYQNVRLDTASTTRHKFGKLYSDGGICKLNLNLLIRLT